MSRIFLSHSSIDNFAARALADWLAEEGWADVFLDIDPERGIAAGQRWERSLHQAADRCEAVIFLVTRAWIDSGWCREEYGLARRLNKQLFAVVAERGLGVADLPLELKDTWQITNLVAGADHRIFRATLASSEEERHVLFSRGGLARLRAGLRKAGLDAREFPWPPEGAKEPAPYVGLRALAADEAGLFFGRDADLVKALDRLRGLSEAAAPRIAVILGASGAGKSSFLRAGLLPRMARDDAHFLCLPAIRPARDPIEGETGLIAALDTAVTEPHARADIRAAVAQGADSVRALLRPLVRATMARRLVDQKTDRPPVVVVPVDQAEELFSAETDGAALLALLAALAKDDAPAVMLLFAIRSDAYDALERAKMLEGLAQLALPLLPMPRHAARAIIEGPATRYAASGRKLDLDPRLTQALLDGLDQGGGRDTLPLLAFSLEHLWREYGRTGALTHDHYEALGGMPGAIEAGVRRAYARADRDPGIPRDMAARDALLRRGLVPWLAGIDPDTRAPRRMVARADDIPTEAKPLIDLLVEERLLSRSVDEANVVTIEPVHEALLRQWGKLKGWLEEDFALLATLEAVQRASRDWDANGRAEPWLAHRGQRLVEASSLAERLDLAAKLGPQDRSYLASCRAHEDAIRAEAKRVRAEREVSRQAEKDSIRVAIQLAKERFRRSTIIVFASLSIGACLLIAAFSKHYARISADEQVLESNFHHITWLDAYSRQALDLGRPGTALALSLEIFRLNEWRTDASLLGDETSIDTSFNLLLGSAQLSVFRALNQINSQKINSWERDSGRDALIIAPSVIDHVLEPPNNAVGMILCGANELKLVLSDGSSRSVQEPGGHPTWRDNEMFKNHCDSLISYGAKFTKDPIRSSDNSSTTASTRWLEYHGYRIETSVDGFIVIEHPDGQRKKVRAHARKVDFLAEGSSYGVPTSRTGLYQGDFTFFTGTDDGSLRFWDAGSNACLYELTGVPALPTAVKIVDDKIIVASADGSIGAWPLPKWGEPLIDSARKIAREGTDTVLIPPFD